MKPDIASATEKPLAPFNCKKMSSKLGIGCLGTWIALLIMFDGSKQILTLPLVSLTVMLLHQAVGAYCRYIFPSLSILLNCSLILVCLTTGWTGWRWMASWTGFTVGSMLKVTGLPSCPSPVCTFWNSARTHFMVRVVLGWVTFERRVDDVGSSWLGMSLRRELSAIK